MHDNKHMQSNDRMKVAITAYACDATAGSEPGVGYAWTRAASSVADVWLLTARLDDNTRQSLLDKGVHIVEIAVPHFSQIPQISYLSWLVLAAIRLRRLNAERTFDLTHHLTYANDWLPSPTLKGVPHIWGPVGGSTTLPRQLARFYPRSVYVRYEVKKAIVSAISPFMKLWTRRSVYLVLAQSGDTARRYDKHPHVVIRPNCVIPDFGPSFSENSSRILEGNNAALVGRLIKEKGGALILRAFADDRLSHWTLHFYGDGPDRQYLEAFALELGISERVRFHGKVSRRTAMREMASMTCVLAVTAAEQGGWSVAEALATGTPVVAWSHGGPAEIVAENGNGIVVEPGEDPLEALRLGIARVAELRSRQPSDRFSEEALQRDVRSWYLDLVR